MPPQCGPFLRNRSIYWPPIHPPTVQTQCLSVGGGKECQDDAESLPTIPEPLHLTRRLMTKYALPQGQGFGPRLAALRKAAGFTQHQLADELGISRRRIAYYESESDHPPANLLADLARALNVSTDQLLTMHRRPSAPPRHRSVRGWNGGSSRSNSSAPSPSSSC